MKSSYKSSASIDIKNAITENQLIFFNMKVNSAPP
ncbi:MAG: hypothetical protein Satyrvirus22_19 [Satyrvirus sp.]|uniref:Uncharacterized protein n=1 Tax=Satyrvirus sp. TaxID=2487771 RepID=A0A3G5AEA7_9VIRU|nr:MAG: hypothetical protein Satyrvirus22_19 [Satyrvirus sp.]